LALFLSQNYEWNKCLKKIPCCWTSLVDTLRFCWKSIQLFCSMKQPPFMLFYLFIIIFWQLNQVMVTLFWFTIKDTINVRILKKIVFDFVDTYIYIAKNTNRIKLGWCHMILLIQINKWFRKWGFERPWSSPSKVIIIDWLNGNKAVALYIK